MSIIFMSPPISSNIFLYATFNVYPFMVTQQAISHFLFNQYHVVKIMDDDEVDEKYLCPVCCDILKLPVMTPCRHIFCTECLSQCIRRVDNCPICRKKLEWNKCMKYTKLEKEIESIKIRCRYCNKEISLQLFSTHATSCPKRPHRTIPRELKPHTSQCIPNPGPNRATFTCPVCCLANLDCVGLRDHCNEQHSSVKIKAVCPVCSCMPWGNPNQESGDFIGHLNLRHKFEYDTFVDYQQDDDHALEAALRASLQNN